MLSHNDVSKRKVFSITMVINEEDIIESFVRYHTNILDGMVIWDIGSGDNTVSILNQMKNEGLPIYIFEKSVEETVSYERIPTLLKYTLEQFDPDFIFPLDSDEFLFSSQKNHPRNVINSFDLNKVYYIKSITYVPQNTDDTNERFIPKRIQHSYPEEFEQYFKVALSKDMIINHDIRFSPGNHDIQSQNNTDNMILGEITEDLRIAHFPIRSSEQIMSKVLIGWINNLSRPDRLPGEAFHWGIFYNKIKDNKSLFENKFQEIVYDYLRFDDKDKSRILLRPLNLLFCKDISLKYINSIGANPLKNLLQNCETLALKCARLEKQIIKK